MQVKKDASHENMFRYFSDKQEVYQKFQSDQREDANRAAIYLIGVFACIIAFEFFHSVFVVLLGFVLGKGYLSAFIDMSNRNFLMHMIDWMEEQRE